MKSMRHLEKLVRVKYDQQSEDKNKVKFILCTHTGKILESMIKEIYHIAFICLNK